MTRYIIFGAGSPIEVDSYHPEIAEAIVVETFGVKIENLVCVRKCDVMLSGERCT